MIFVFQFSKDDKVSFSVNSQSFLAERIELELAILRIGIDGNIKVELCVGNVRYSKRI